MSCIWKGDLSSVAWPHHDPLCVDLPLEMWWMDDHGGEAVPRLDDVSLKFAKYVRISDVPLWAISGPEMVVMTRDTGCLEYFNAFASLGGVALRILVAGEASAFDEIVIFAVRDESSTKIAARPLNTRISFPKRANTQQLSSLVPNAVADPLNDPPPQPPEQALADPPAAPLGEPMNASLARAARPALRNASVAAQAEPSKPRSTNKPVTDVKKTVQQTIMGALRLRGIRSSSPDFKKMYFSVLSLVELSLRKLDAHQITLHIIHDKVEAILSTID